MIDYNYKYLKYKSKYEKLKKTFYGGNNSNNYAIFMLCMLKDHYALGACITAYNHRYYIKKQSLNIKLVIMCDDYIFNKYESMLKKFFDKVINIKLKKYKISNKYKYNKEKYTWLSYSLNKWECLKYDKYNKILFLDIDILVNNSSFYNIFNFKTPAFYNIHINKKCNSGEQLNYNLIDETYKDYIKNIKKHGTIDGGICLFNPNKDLYIDYYKFVNELYKNGIYSIYKSGPDETSLFYYFMRNNIKLYNICSEYIVIPWKNLKNKNKIDNAKSYNYLATIKPWTKPKFLTWPEEILWHDIYDIIPNKKMIETLYDKTLLETFNYFYKLNSDKKKEFFNNMLKHKFYLIKNINNSKNKLKKIKKLNKYIKSNFNYGILNRSKPLQ